MLLFFVACAPARLIDTTGVNLDVTYGEHLASPYVLGAAFDLLLEPRDDRPDGWSVTSSDPDVLLLGDGVVDRFEDEDGHLEVPALAVGVGTATLSIRDPDGEERFTAEAEVAAPTRFELRSAGDLEKSGSADELDEPRVAVGGSAGFRVDFFDEGRSLAGAGGLALGAPESVATVDETAFARDRDWIVVSPSEAGELAIEVSTGGFTVGTATFQAVDPSDIVAIDLDRDPESNADEGDSLRVVATGLDRSGERVFGSPLAWTEGGVPVEGWGDVYGYVFDPAVTTEVSVSVGDTSEVFTVHGGGGSVHDSSSIGCVVANVGPVGAAIGLAALGVLRRRRQRREG